MISETKYENARKERGYEIYQNCEMTRDEKRNGWLIPSQSGDKQYFVNDSFKCNCGS